MCQSVLLIVNSFKNIFHMISEDPMRGLHAFERHVIINSKKK